MTGAWPVVAATGHRSQHLDPSAQHWVREKLQAGAVWLRDHCGTRIAVSGMALGVDTWWAQAALDAGLELHAYIPFESQSRLWGPEDYAEWVRLRGLATVPKVLHADPVSKRQAVGYLHGRNDAMLRNADAVIAVWLAGETDGGTFSAVRKAQARKLPGVHLEPASRRVRTVEPGGWF